MTGFYLYQDLDGCLADFKKGVSDWIYKLLTGELEIKNSKSAPRKIRKYIAKHGRSYKLLTEEDLNLREVKDLMYLVASQPGFFASLERIDNDLWETIMSATCFDNIRFLTAPIGVHAEKDKKTWCRETLQSSYECIVVDRKDKMQFANTHNVLIDDNEKTCKEWREAGGIAFQWPLEQAQLYRFLSLHSQSKVS